MHDRRTRAERRAQQAREIADNQNALRRNIAEATRLVDETEKMLQRHQKERDEDEDDAG